MRGCLSGTVAAAARATRCAPPAHLHDPRRAAANEPDRTHAARAQRGIVVLVARTPRDVARDGRAQILDGDRVPAEIVVVDQSDRAHETLPALAPPDGCHLVYVHGPERGLSRARNQGMRVARHDLLVFIDDDMLVHGAWLGAMAAELRRRGPRWIVTGQVRELHGDGALALVRQRRFHAAGVPRASAARSAIPGNMGFHRSVVTQIGQFDERLGAGSSFPGAEDNDFGYRFLRAGGAIAYLPAALTSSPCVAKRIGDLLPCGGRTEEGRARFTPSTSSAEIGTRRAAICGFSRITPGGSHVACASSRGALEATWRTSVA